MKTQKFLIATEGTFQGRHISAECIDSILNNFISGGQTIPVVYDFLDWSPALSEVVALAVDTDGEKKRLYAEIRATKELQQMAERQVDYFAVPAILCVDGVAIHSRLVSVGVTKDSLIPGLDGLQFSKANYPDMHFFAPECRGETPSQKGAASGKGVYLARYYHHGVHAGNIRYEIEAWGMNSPVREAGIKRQLDEFISTLQVDWRGL